jgi:transcriptional regulator with XRE-family HTH domain
MIEKNIDLVKKVRKQLCLTQAELGKLLDLDRNYIYMMEAGKKPVSDKTLRKLNQLISEIEGKTKNKDKTKNSMRDSRLEYCTAEDYRDENRRLHGVIENLQKALDQAQTNLSEALKIINNE